MSLAPFLAASPSPEPYGTERGWRGQPSQPDAPVPNLSHSYMSLEHSPWENQPRKHAPVCHHARVSQEAIISRADPPQPLSPACTDRPPCSRGPGSGIITCLSLGFAGESGSDTLIM